MTDPLFQRWQPGTGFFGFFEAEDDAAVAAALLDAAESALAARGAARIAGPVRLRIARALRSIRTARLLLLGVVPAFRGRGVAALLAGSLHEAGRACGITSCELSLIQGSNDPVRHVVDAFQAPRTKTVRLYGREIGSRLRQ